MERYIKITDNNANGAVLYDGPASGYRDALVNVFGGVTPEVDCCIETLVVRDMVNEDTAPYENYLGITVESYAHDDRHFWVEE